VRVYDLNGKTVFDKRAAVDLAAQGVGEALVLPQMKPITPVYFVRCELFDSGNRKIAENVYWQSVTPDDVGPRSNDKAFDVKQESWADFTPLQSMAKVKLDVEASLRKTSEESEVAVSLRNPTGQVAFFVRAEITAGRDGNEILPITYDNNYVTVFPGETVVMHGHIEKADMRRDQPWLRVEGVNAPKVLAAIR